MNVLVSIKSGKQVSISTNFGMFVSGENDNGQNVCCKLLISFFSNFHCFIPASVIESSKFRE